MDDDELQAIRAARMNELKSQKPEKDPKDDMRASVLPQLLTQDARERLNRVRIVKPDRADEVEQLVIRMGQTGQLGQKVTEDDLVRLLDQLAQRDQSNNKLKFSRREDYDEDEPAVPPALNAPVNDNESDDDFFD